MTKTYAEKGFFEWHEDSLCVTLREQGGSYGGDSEMLIVDTLVFDNAQITSKLNYSHPTWGGNAILSQAQPDRQ